MLNVSPTEREHPTSNIQQHKAFVLDVEGSHILWKSLGEAQSHPVGMTRSVENDVSPSLSASRRDASTARRHPCGMPKILYDTFFYRENHPYGMLFV